MRFFLLLLILIATVPAFAQDESTLFTTADNKFQFEMPINWELMKEENGRVTLIHVGEVAQYTVISLGMTDAAPSFDDDPEAVQFMLGREATPDDFEVQQIGDYKVLIRETDAEEIDTLFAIILMEDGVIGALEANEMDFPVDIEFLRPIVDSIITSLTYIKPENNPFDELDLIAPDTSDLTITYESESGLFAFDYPEDWKIEPLDTDIVLLGTPDLTPTSIPDLGIQVFVSHKPSGVDASGAFLHQILGIMMENVSSPEDAYIVDFNLNGRRASIVQDDSSSNDLVLLALLIDDNTFAMLNGIPSDFDMKETESIVLAVASTLRIIEPDREIVEVDTSILTETASIFDGFYSFDYPDGWVLDVSEELVQLYSSAEGDSDKIEDNQITLIINVFPKTGEDGLDANSTLVEVAETIQSPTRLESTPAMEILLNGSPAVLMDMGIPGMGGHVVYISLDRDLVGQVMMIAGEDDFDQFKEVALAIASSITLGN